jgi:hypothetical protein
VVVVGAGAVVVVVGGPVVVLVVGDGFVVVVGVGAVVVVGVGFLVGVVVTVELVVSNGIVDVGDLPDPPLKSEGDKRLGIAGPVV